ncbi:tRNA lysidine(34) synthetase TilS [Gleimia hominis]|uniref:tRNA lysidine(34) synthetase TilS n=1 Tax=Gleimia hominis TaxID=595468 RepID=UPI000C80B057|nr:tRNA lysidine(34) synthetase TilS [Gleimia hominis]WIK64495.1 tRNA lysidine(34) synthetase TilS [Gleimia hominis]
MRHPAEPKYPPLEPRYPQRSKGKRTTGAEHAEAQNVPQTARLKREETRGAARPAVCDLVGATPLGSVRAVSLALRQWMLHHQPSRVVCACSGGADSLSLTITAADQAFRMGVPVEARIVDHGLRPESADESAGVKQLLEKLGVPTRVLAPTVGTDGGVEAAARDARYSALQSDAAQTPGTTVLLGHTMDDQAESVLLGLSRGSGARSIAGMRAYARTDHGGTSVGWGRPLLGVRREQTLQACVELGVPVVHDPTNELDGPWETAQGTPRPRIALRHRAIPTLCHALGQDIVPALARTAQLLQADTQALDAIAARVLSDHGLDVDVLAAQSQAVRTRVLRMAVQAVQSPQVPLTLEHTRALDKLVTDYRGQGPIVLPRNLRAWRTQRDESGKRWIRIRFVE